MRWKLKKILLVIQENVSLSIKFLKLREVNVFSHVCLSFYSYGGNPHVTTANDAIGQSQVTWGPLSPYRNQPCPYPCPLRSPHRHPLVLITQGPPPSLYRDPIHVQTCSLHILDCRHVGGWHSTEMSSCLFAFLL